MAFAAWPHQTRAIEESLSLFAGGVRRLCVTIPTGGGKTYIARELALRTIRQGKKCVFYTNRKALISQSSRDFSKHDVPHGIRASGYEHEPWEPFQVSSIQTETTRLKDPESNRGWQLHDAQLVIVDEAHLNAGASMMSIITEHVNRGANVLGLTATPIDLGHAYDHLLVAATNSELRACGAIVPAWHYGCDEPEMKKLKPGEDPTEKTARKMMMNATIYGRVLEWYRKLNPEQKPTLLFAPGVKESIWFAEQFVKAGIPAAHIDGENIWWNGEWMPSDRRDDLFQAVACGDIKVMTNRFVAREGLDIPAISHIIFATIMGATGTYVQAGGRGLRASPGKEKCVIQDHGGHYWRPGLGSLNADRHWELDYTDSMIAGLYVERFHQKQEKQPKRCPQCALVMDRGVCMCGFQIDTRPYSRAVVQTDGTLKEMSALPLKPRRIDKRYNAVENWKRMFWGWRKSPRVDKTFREMIAYYQVENNWNYPDPSWPFYPRHTIDLFRKVKAVPFDRLNPEVK